MFSIGVRPPIGSDVAALVESVRELSTGTLGHVTDFGYARGIVPMTRPSKVCGLAYTVRMPQRDSTAAHYAIDHAMPGEVLVIDTSGSDFRASWGGIAAYAAYNRRIAGVVVDGPITDWDELMECGVPVWFNGKTSSLAGRRMGLEGAVEIPIQVGGAVVSPGDIVLGDSDGVYFIDREYARQRIGELLKREKGEIEIRRRIDSGEALSSISGAGAHMTAS